MPTTNPVPSYDPTDLLFNAQKLDEVVNGAGSTYTDRLGVTRRTLGGIDAEAETRMDAIDAAAIAQRDNIQDAADLVLAAAGYAPPVAYAAGISLTLQTQTVSYNGDTYAPKQADLPFTTIGAFETAKFRLIQGVASADLPALVGQDLQDYAALRAYTGQAKRIYITGLLVTAKPAGIAGVFQHDQTDTTSTDNDGTIIVGADGRRWKRDYIGNVKVDWFGADPFGVVDSSIKIQNGINVTKNKEILEFNGIYRCDSGLVIGRGSKLLGQNTSMPARGTVNENVTKIYFTSTSAGFIGIDVDITVADAGYVRGVSVEGIYVEGAIAPGSIGINANRLATARFKNVGVEKFARGLNVIYGMTCTYDSINIQGCTEAALYLENSYSVTTSQRFVDCVFRDSPWGVIMAVPNGQYMLDTVFDHCLIESTTVGGMNIHNGCSVTIIEPYFENVPDYSVSMSGSAIRLYADGTSDRSNTINVCNIIGGDISGPNTGTGFANALIYVGAGAASVNIVGGLYQRALHGIQVDPACKNRVVNAERPSFVSVTNVYTGTDAQRSGVWPTGVLTGSAQTLKNYSSLFGSPLTVDADTLLIRNSSNTSYYTKHSAASTEVQEVNAIGAPGSSVSYRVQIQKSGTLQEAARYTFNGYSKFTSTGAYSVPNVSSGSGDLSHSFLVDGAVNALLVSNLSTAAAAVCVRTTKPDITNGSHFAATRTDNAGTVYVVRANGDVANVNNVYGALSDVKLKQDIIDASSQWDDIKALAVKKYRLKDDPEGPVHIGLIAQEAELVSPGLIEETADMAPVEVEYVDDAGAVVSRIEYQDAGTTTKSIKYSIVNIKMLKALQEAMVRIEALEAEIQAMKS